jgi:hypothetical protein
MEEISGHNQRGKQTSLTLYVLTCLHALYVPVREIYNVVLGVAYIV